jgi:hypothetical protein
MRGGDADLTYPLPWADDETSSFVETRERFPELLEAAGFEERIGNNIAATMAGILSPVLMTARAI